MKKILALLFAAMLLLSAVGCGGASGKTETATDGKGDTAGLSNVMEATKTQQESSANETTNYKKAITIALDANISSLDVHTNSSATNDYINKMTYNQLLYFNWDTKEIEPELAESWEVEAPDRYLFHLRKDVTFSNGQPFTADDVYFTFMERTVAVNATTMGKVSGLMKDIEVIDDYTVRFILKDPNADFLHNIYVPTGSIMNREACEADPEQGHLIGTAGWIVKDWLVNDYVHLVKYNDSWVWREKGETPTEEVTFKCMPEASSRAVALQNGEVDTVVALADADLPALEGDSKLELLSYLQERVYYYMFNMRSGKFAQDVNLRNAVAFAINYEDLCEHATSGRGQVATTMWGLNQFGYFDDFEEKIEYNPEKAKEYLAKSSAPDGLTIKILVTTAFQGDATLIQSNLADIGIIADINATDTAGFNAAVAEDAADLMIFNITQRTDGDRFSFIPDIKNSTNRAHYDNPEMLQEFIDGRSTTDEATRLAIYKQIQIELNEQKPYVAMYVGVGNTGWRKGVSGIELAPDTKHDYSFIRSVE